MTGPKLAVQAPRDWPHAACVETNPELFHRRETEADAKAVCRGCDALKACKAEALADPSITGVWGATTDDERKAMRSRARRKVIPATWKHGTENGYANHRRAGEPSCDECKAAAERANARRTARKAEQRRHRKATA